MNDVMIFGCCRDCLPSVGCMIQNPSPSCYALAMITLSTSMICHREYFLGLDLSPFFFIFFVSIYLCFQEPTNSSLYLFSVGLILV